jgi:hypothetical protein
MLIKLIVCTHSAKHTPQFFDNIMNLMRMQGMQQTLFIRNDVMQHLHEDERRRRIQRFGVIDHQTCVERVMKTLTAS